MATTVSLYDKLLWMLKVHISALKPQTSAHKCKKYAVAVSVATQHAKRSCSQHWEGILNGRHPWDSSVFPLDSAFTYAGSRSANFRQAAIQVEDPTELCHTHSMAACFSDSAMHIFTEGRSCS